MRVLIADDHPLVGDALSRVIRQMQPDADLVRAEDGPSLMRLAAESAPDLALVDLNMPGMGGLDGLRRLRERFPALPVIVASAQEDPTTIRAVLACGASGFVPKTDPPELLRQAIQLVLAGGVYLPARTLADFRDGVPPPAPPQADGGLTTRQRDVLRLLLRGQPNKLIARELNLTEGTVKIHIAAILRALNARNRTEAVIRAREAGLTD